MENNESPKNFITKITEFFKKIGKNVKEFFEKEEVKKITSKKEFPAFALILVFFVVVLISCAVHNHKENQVATSNVATKESATKVSNNGLITDDDGEVRTDLTAVEVAKLMGNGINLGNSLECYAHWTGMTSGDFSLATIETMYGMPVTTAEIVESMKNAGFDTLRIPISWTNAMFNYESGDYTIDEAYLDRVEEIINYALDEDMYVIINDHWDGGWWAMFGSSDMATRTKAMEMYTSMWTTIATRYEEYSDHLIFEGGNEELGNRLNDEYNGATGIFTLDELYVKVNSINQAFVDTVRATGGNNADRFLLIPGFNADIDYTVDSRFVMPTDTATGKLLLSVHYYDPWDYCGSTAVSAWGSEANLTEMNDQFAKLTKFTEAGVGVVVGEYAVQMEDGAFKAGTDTYYGNLLDNCDLYGYAPILWDTNEAFDRTTGEFTNDTIGKLFTDRVSPELEKDTLAEDASESIQSRVAYARAQDVNYGYNDEVEGNVAWIMFKSADGSVIYSPDGTYDSKNKTTGIKATDITVTGTGTYTIGLDFTALNGAHGISMLAIGISDGETAFPNYAIDIKQILLNGQEISLDGVPYTCSDDGTNTRLNLYNTVVSVHGLRRVANGANSAAASADVVDESLFTYISTLQIVFDYYEVSEQNLLAN